MHAFFVRTMENVINLDKLEPGIHHFDFHLDNAYLRSVEKTELLGLEIDAKAMLNLLTEGFDLTVAVEGTVNVTCDRCLEPMDLVVSAEDDMTTDAMDAILENKKGNTVDLNWLAYELTVVNLPLVHSHQNGGCNPQMDNLLQSHLCTTEEPEA